MGTSVLPSLAGLGFPVTRTPTWDTTIQQAISGKETRIARQTYPRWKWDLAYSVLRSNASFTELQQLAGFFNARQGMFDTFLYADADDNAVTGQAIGTGDGSTTAFPLVRAFGTFVEPVLAPNVVSTVYLDGIAFNQTGYSPPTNGALTSTAAGSLGATTYYVKTTWVTLAGETAPSSETSLSVAANHVLNIAAPAGAPAVATGWRAYVSNTAGGGSGAETLQATLSTSASFVEPTSGLVTGAAPPPGNYTGYNVSNWGVANPGVITFGAAPTNTTTITADFSYYWPCRMADDSLPFSLFLSGMYECKKFSFISVKN